MSHVPITENKIFYSHELSNEDYHLDPAISSSGIKSFKECAAIYYDKFLSPDKEPFDETKFTRMGSFAHIKLLEPHKFYNEYAVSPEFAVTNRGKKNEALKPMNRNHSDYGAFEDTCITMEKKPILHSEFNNIQAMSQAVKNHPLASRMLMNGQEEMSFFAHDEETGLMLRARPDYLVESPSHGICLIDYKTTSISMRIRKQSNHAFGLDRHIQAAHHKRVAELATGGRIDHVIYITQMVERPHLIKFFRMPPASIERGINERRFYLDNMSECLATGIWPGYSDEIEDYIEPGYLDDDYA